MATEHRITHPGNQGEVRQIVKVPSASRPGRVHYVDPEQGVCSCEGFYFNRRCRHLDALSRFEVQPVHNSRIGAIEYAIVERETGKVEGFRPSRSDALADVVELGGAA